MRKTQKLKIQVKPSQLMAALCFAFSEVSFAVCTGAGALTASANTVTCDATNPGTGESIDTLAGNDTVNMHSGNLGAVQQGLGLDVYNQTGGVIASLDQGAGLDTATISGGEITGEFTDGDTVYFSGGSIGNVNLVTGDNKFYMSGTANIVGTLNSEQGADLYELTGGSIGGRITTGSGNDTMVLDGTQIGNDIVFEGGNDSMNWVSGQVAGGIYMDQKPGLTGNGTDGTDKLTISSPNYDVSQILDGGDDVLASDALVDDVI